MPTGVVRALEASEVPSAFLSFAQLRNRSANLDVGWRAFFFLLWVAICDIRVCICMHMLGRIGVRVCSG
jgi:hypothetical protein